MPPASRKRARDNDAEPIVKTEDEPAAAAASTPMDTAESPFSPTLDYEAARRAQIARNQALLSSLTGISASTSLTSEEHAARLSAQAASDARRRASAAERRREREERFALMPRRDLPGRRAKQGEVNYNDDKFGAHAAAAAASSSSSAAAASSSSNGRTGDDDADMPPRENASLSDFFQVENYPISNSFSAKSSKGVSTLPLRELRQHLGEWIPLTYHTPKAAAMSFLVAGWPSEENPASKRAPPQFNRMSGIQKLANHIALFINVNEEEGKGAYGNQWLDDGRRITWYAQPTQRVDTPVIGQIISCARAKQREIQGLAGREEEEYAREILHQGKEEEGAAAAAGGAEAKPAKQKKVERPQKKKTAAVKKESEEDDKADESASFDPMSVLLFLRFSGAGYIYAGQVAYFAHDTRRTPMKFEFTLAEYDVLKTKEAFLELQPDGGKKLRAQNKATGKA
jgi:hypothetical protein